MVSRYGKKMRELERSVAKQARSRHECPRCGKRSVKRVSAGIWACRSCGVKFAGGAYSPETEGGAATRRALKRERPSASEEPAE